MPNLYGENVIDMGTMSFDSEEYTWNFEKDGEVNKLASYDLASNQVDYYSTNGVVTIDVSQIECMAIEKANASNCLAILEN